MIDQSNSHGLRRASRTSSDGIRNASNRFESAYKAKNTSHSARDSKLESLENLEILESLKWFRSILHAFRLILSKRYHRRKISNKVWKDRVVIIIWDSGKFQASNRVENYSNFSPHVPYGYEAFQIPSLRTNSSLDSENTRFFSVSYSTLLTSFRI